MSRAAVSYIFNSSDIPSNWQATDIDNKTLMK
jgi:hypothetical protein